MAVGKRRVLTAETATVYNSLAQTSFKTLSPSFVHTEMGWEAVLLHSQRRQHPSQPHQQRMTPAKDKEEEKALVAFVKRLSCIPNNPAC